jgi:hypothetical protein
METKQLTMSNSTEKAKTRLRQAANLLNNLKLTFDIKMEKSVVVSSTSKEAGQLLVKQQTSTSQFNSILPTCLEHLKEHIIRTRFENDCQTHFVTHSRVAVSS